MYLGIDVGTSAAKVVLVDAQGIQHAQAEAPLTLSTPQPYWCEQRPEAWWDAVLTCAGKLAAQHPKLWSEVAAIGLSGQMHGAVLLDRAGQVIRPAILWNDGRAHAECALMSERAPDLGQIAGVPALPGFTAPMLLWLARHEPRSLDRIAHLLLPKDYIGHRLHGGLTSDASDAAGTLLLDQATRNWSPALCAAAGVDPDWLPRILPSAAVAGRLDAPVAARLGLRRGLPVAAGAGDTPAGAVGIGAVQAGQAVLSIGTSAQLFVPMDHYAPRPERMLHSFAHAVPDMWYAMAALLNGARPLAWFAEMTGAALPDLLAEAETASDAPLCLPYLSGERTPHGDPHVRGAFFGLDTGTSRGQMMRAVVEAVAFSLADAADALSGEDLGRLYAVGGGTRSRLLLQLVADLLGAELHSGVRAATGPAFGAARLAAIADGACDWSDLAEMPPADTVVRPHAGHGQALREKHARFRALYACLKPMTAIPA